MQQEIQNLMKNIKMSDEPEKEIEQVECPTCGKKHPFYERDGDGTYLAENTCSSVCSKYYNRKTRIKDYLRDMQVPKRYIDCSFDNIKMDESNQATLTKLKLFKKLDKSLFISGGVGTGKTHMAVALMRSLALTQIEQSVFYSATDVLLKLRSAFNDESISEESMFSKFTTQSILVIDDIGTEKLSDYVIQSWYRIIDYRYSNCFPTVYTSNLSMKEIASRFGDRIASRLSSGFVYTVKGRDRRL